ncbi:hypothetical protein H2198_003159 [Neophaeococcomyces mojaviensis]|uniref:Uncharacterized protein n=1 Tax=Neophaeococcomyces mojaviensis TaxID=3383035 RepID=A0ACC3ACP7_9EURO|nr:hypothetical protein H2198_003159 [Knufia sp. JES_112]
MASMRDQYELVDSPSPVLHENVKYGISVRRKPLPETRYESLTSENDHHFRDEPIEPHPQLDIWKFFPFGGLLLTSILCGFLLAVAIKGWATSGDFYHFVVNNRALTSLIVQVLAALLGLIHVNAVCYLINYWTRIHINLKTVSLNTLHLWRGLTTPTTLWDLQISQGPFIRNSKGLFAYAVGVKFQGQLLTSAASATTVDNSPSVHQKYDNSQYVYVGRSYGAGAVVGLDDDTIQADALNTAYSYQEVSYQVSVDCIYNATNRFRLRKDSGWSYIAYGYLPNSPAGVSEYSTYWSNQGDAFAIVAMGVSYAAKPSSRRYVGFAAGSAYPFLNNTQCTLDFQPKLFNVSVNIADRNITVTPMQNVAEFDLSYNITHSVARQFTIISSAQTNLYMSLVGDSFNSSIAAYRESISNWTATPSDNDVSLTGIENAIVAMADDIVVCYKSAQLMIAKDVETQTVLVQRRAITLGKKTFIYLLSALNGLIVVATIIEAIRTKLWRRLPHFDYLDTRDLVFSIWRAAQARTVSADGFDTPNGSGHRDRAITAVRLQNTNDGELLTLQQR